MSYRPRYKEQYGSPMSGVVMLTMGVAQDVDDSNVYDEQWNNDVRDLVETCNPNVLTLFEHRMSIMELKSPCTYLGISQRFYHDALSLMMAKATRDWMKITNIEGNNCEKNGGYQRTF